VIENKAAGRAFLAIWIILAQRTGTPGAIPVRWRAILFFHKKLRFVTGHLPALAGPAKAGFATRMKKNQN